MGQFSGDVVHIVRSLMPRAATGQGGLFSGDNPTAYNASDPLRLWVIQVVIIIAMTQGLSLIFSRIRQPRVISEVIGGIILGPTVMGRIPGFQNRIFPTTGMPFLTLTSTIGLVLYLFLVGMEIDVRIIRRNVMSSTAVSVAGLVVPLGLGAALGVALYKQFVPPSVNYGYFVLFSAVAIGITAFPVLCRILTELKLLDTTVGVVTLSAGVGNDVVGWVLLALSVALVNAGSGLTALWVLLASAGYVIFLLFPVRLAYVWLARRTGSLETGQPTPFMMTITILIVLISAFFTDVIGVHPIFGGFLAGLIIPHDGGYAISIVEKIEDLVTILFLPIYFTLSGLKTNLGALNDGKTWGYVFLICTVSFSSKFFACFAAAKTMKFNFRESGAIGSLMSCKGLVELIVLNVGLQAGILDTRTFSMFVVQALILTFMTTPLTLLFYPERYRVRASTGTVRDKPQQSEQGDGPKQPEDVRTKFAMILDKIEQLPSAMVLTQLLQPPSSFLSPPVSNNASVEDEKAAEAGALATLSHRPMAQAHPQITIDALRLIELTARASDVLRSQEAESLMHSDPVVSVFRTFGYLNRLLVSAALSVVPYDEFSTVVANHTRESESDMVIIPWCRGSRVDADEHGRMASANNPFDGVFNKSSGHDQTRSVVYSEFIRKVFMTSPADVALFVDRGVTSAPSSGTADQHLFLPFFGGPDDRLALSFVMQLCSNPSVTASVVKMEKTDEITPVSSIEDKAGHGIINQHNTLAIPDTVYGNRDTQTRLASDTADNLAWGRYSKGTSSRVTFTHQASPKPLHALLETVTSEVALHAKSERTVIVVVGRSRRMAVESHQSELRQLVLKRGSSVGSELPKTLGDVGAALVVASTNASLLVMQARVSRS
jgi:Kef-type K+ transport system membrane component KefB